MDAGVTEPVHVAMPRFQQSRNLGCRLAMPATCWPIVRPRPVNPLLAKEGVPSNRDDVRSCDPGEQPRRSLDRQPLLLAQSLHGPSLIRDNGLRHVLSEEAEEGV